MIRYVRTTVACLSTLALVASLSDCAVGPDFKRPKPPTDTNYGNAPSNGPTAASPATGGGQASSEAIPNGDHAQRFVAEMDIPAQWWTLFQSTRLNGLVEQAIKGNPNITAARASLRQAHELYLAERSTFWPVAQGTFSAQRARNAVGTIANPTNLPQANPYYNLFNAQLNVSYMPDVFGGTRRAVEAARAQDDAARFQLEATYLTLTSNVVVTAITEASLRGQIEATQRLLELQHQVTERVRKQLTVGTTSALDVLSQEAAEAQTAATLPPLQKQLGQTRDLLTALLGKLPAEEPPDTFRLDELTLPGDLPVSLPSKLVEQRPDIRQAEENLHFASAQAGVAIADMLPQFAITGTWGSTSLSMSDLFKSGTGFWNAGASLTQTLFDAGALLHKHRAADAALDQAGAQYRAAVILACQNVADTLRALQADADALEADAETARAAKSAFDLARKQLDVGTVSFVAVMNAETTYQQAEVALVQAQGNRYSDTAGLFQALGGGWWNRSKGSNL